MRLVSSRQRQRLPGLSLTHLHPTRAPPQLQLQLQRVVGSHRALREQCERAHVPVAPGGKAELAQWQESAEVARLRSALVEVQAQLDQARQSAAAAASRQGSASGEDGRGASAPMGATARYLERERATLLAAKATAEEVCWGGCAVDSAACLALCGCAVDSAACLAARPHHRELPSKTPRFPRPY